MLISTAKYLYKGFKSLYCITQQSFLFIISDVLSQIGVFQPGLKDYSKNIPSWFKNILQQHKFKEFGVLLFLNLEYYLSEQRVKHVCFCNQMVLKSRYNLLLIAEYDVSQQKVYRQVFVLIYTRKQITIFFFLFSAFAIGHFRDR